MKTEKLKQDHQPNPKTNTEEIPFYEVDGRLFIGWCGARDVKAYLKKEAA